MRFRTVISLSTVFLVCSAIALWAHTQPARTLPAPENQSVSGKISGIGDAAFSVDVQKDQKVETIQFLIDGDTKVDGKLTVGAQTSVEYRSDEGSNIAVHVVVESSSGYGPPSF
jgi:hypothetical protein